MNGVAKMKSLATKFSLTNALMFSIAVFAFKLSNWLLTKSFITLEILNRLSHGRSRGF